jgi:hypothetical protein
VAKTEQIQLRVSRVEKAALVRRARAEGLDLSAWMLRRLLPPQRARWSELVESLSGSAKPSFVLAEIHDFLAALGQGELHEAVGELPRARLDEISANQLAAMVETRCAQLRVRPPEWVLDVPPLTVSWFGTDLMSLRLHLLCHSPPAFRRRNLFVDSTIGART